jgi:hypothetical protein
MSIERDHPASVDAHADEEWLEEESGPGPSPFPQGMVVWHGDAQNEDCPLNRLSYKDIPQPWQSVASEKAIRLLGEYAHESIVIQQEFCRETREAQDHYEAEICAVQLKASKMTDVNARLDYYEQAYSQIQKTYQRTIAVFNVLRTWRLTDALGEILDLHTHECRSDCTWTLGRGFPPYYKKPTC